MALKKENPQSSNYDIRKIATKDCIEIWQKATIMPYPRNIREDETGKGQNVSC
jgi:hypothetical protein